MCPYTVKCLNQDKGVEILKYLQFLYGENIQNSFF